MGMETEPECPHNTNYENVDDLVLGNHFTTSYLYVRSTLKSSFITL